MTPAACISGYKEVTLCIGQKYHSELRPAVKSDTCIVTHQIISESQLSPRKHFSAVYGTQEATHYGKLGSPNPHFRHCSYMSYIVWMDTVESVN